VDLFIFSGLQKRTNKKKIGSKIMYFRNTIVRKSIVLFFVIVFLVYFQAVGIWHLGNENERMRIK
jgi:hypothetical protein